MKKVFLDTNIIIDVLLRRHPFWLECSNILQLADDGDIEVYASALSFVNALYVGRKELGTDVALQKLKEFHSIVYTSPIGDDELTAAMLMVGRDFEDNLQYCSALAVDCDVIVSRDLRGIPANGKIKTLSPKDFLNSLVK